MIETLTYTVNIDLGLLDQPPAILPHKPDRAAILRLQDAMRQMDTVELPVTHRFADGLYARELFMPAGTTAVGKIHAKSHFLVVLSGDVTCYTEDGIKRVGPGEVIKTEPGTKRVAYAHADTRLITFHATQETDLDLIERELITPERLEA